MGEPEIVLSLGDMVGKFVAQRKAEAERRAVGADDIEADDFRLLAAIQREGRRGQRRVRRDRGRAVALVEPFRLHALSPPARLAAFQPQA